MVLDVREHKFFRIRSSPARREKICAEALWNSVAQANFFHNDAGELLMRKNGGGGEN